MLQSQKLSRRNDLQTHKKKAKQKFCKYENPKTTARQKRSLCCWEAKQETQNKIGFFFSIILQIRFTHCGLMTNSKYICQINDIHKCSFTYVVH